MENNLLPEIPEVFSEETFNALSILEKALYYSRIHNLGVFPIENSMITENGKRKPNKKPKDKFSWGPYVTRKPTEEEIIEWFKRGNANLAILAGKIYGIVVLDIDCYKDGYDGSFFQTHEIPETWKAKTGRGGYHYFFKYPTGIQVNSKKMHDLGFEFMSEGNYVVGAGSKYIDGDKVFKYSWEPGHGPWETELAEMPDWLIKMSELPRGKSMEVSVRNNYIPKDWAKIMGDIHPEGERDNTLFSIIGKLIYDEKDPTKWETEVLSQILQYNQTHCVPPYPEDKIKSMVKRIGEYEIESRALKTISNGGMEILDRRAGKGAAHAYEIFNFLKEEVKFIVSTTGRVFVEVDNNGKKNLYPINSKEAEKYFLYSYQKTYSGIIGSDSMRNVIVNLESYAVYNAPRKNIHVRVGYNKEENAIYYDLHNEEGTVLKITEDNYEVVPQENIYFRKYGLMAQQDLPEYCDEIDFIWSHFNIKDEEDRILFLVYLIALFIPHIKFPILGLLGDHGSGKTFCFRFTRSLIDPVTDDEFTGYTLTGKPEDFRLQLSQGYYIVYDNLTHLRDDYSRMLCEVVTGGSFSKKLNYEDEDMLILKYSVRVGLGSIKPIIRIDDLAERAIIIKLTKVLSEDPLGETERIQNFLKDRPKILGYIFRIVARTLRNDDVISSNLRMKDFAIYGERIAREMGYKNNLFLNIYKKRISAQDAQVKKTRVPAYMLEGSSGLLESHQWWRGTATELLQLFQEIVEESELPTNPVTLGKDFDNNENIEYLNAKGYRVSKGKSGERIITIERINTESRQDTSDTSDTGNEKTGEESPNESPAGSNEKSIE